MNKVHKTHTHKHTHTRAHTRAHARTHAHAHTHTYTHTHTHTHTHIYIYTHKQTYIHAHAHTYTRTHAHTHTNTYKHTHTNTHTQTRTPAPQMLGRTHVDGSTLLLKQEVIIDDYGVARTDLRSVYPVMIRKRLSYLLSALLYIKLSIIGYKKSLTSLLSFVFTNLWKNI